MPAPDPASRRADRRRVALVTTTINVPRCLDDYLKNAERHGYAEQCVVIVVGDHKTPAEATEYLAGLGKRFPSKVVYLDVPAQRKLLRRWPTLDHVLRYNSIQRRNVGYLQAKLEGAEVIIALDDDNFVAEGSDYIGPHLAAGQTIELPVLSHPSGWWNICERLTCDPPRHFYHRGYPKSKQTFKTGGYTVERKPVRVAVNAGLWLKNPDVDATTNIEEPVNVVAMEELAGSKLTALGRGTWCPFNSQNTSFDVSTLAAMYLVVMHDFYRGYRVGRLDDIWMAYFVRAIGDALGEVVVYGPPVVTQDRNPHNFLKDLGEELGGYVLTEKLVGYLREFKTTSKSYLDGYLDLTYHLRSCLESDPNLDEQAREYFRTMTIGMAAWQEAVADLGRG